VYFIAGEVTQPQIRVIMGRLTKLAAIVWKMNTLAPEVNATKQGKSFKTFSPSVGVGKLFIFVTEEGAT